MPPHDLIGQTLGGRYQIQNLIGKGGMSAVYRAYDPNLRRTVAIKVIHTHLSNNAEFLRRFEEEAASVAHLRHPNIVQVFDFNHDDQGYYMVMEFIPGETLQERLKRLNESGRLMPVDEVLGYATDVCSAVDYAHQRGMIHRDIKPANVMLDFNGKAILMDFGIARIVGGQRFTITGAVIGTAMYMAPEQIQGLRADARADLYSLGVTIFEMLGGRPPYEADSAMTLMMMHLNDPLPDLRRLHPGLPDPLVALVNHTLEKSRDRRFQSAGELTEALNHVRQQIVPEPKEPASESPAEPVAAPPALEGPTPAVDAGAELAATVKHVPQPSESTPTKPAEVVPAAVEPPVGATLVEPPPEKKATPAPAAWTPRANLPEHETRAAREAPKGREATAPPDATMVESAAPRVQRPMSRPASQVSPPAGDYTLVEPSPAPQAAPARQAAANEAAAGVAPAQPRGLNRTWLWLALIVFLAVVGVGGYFLSTYGFSFLKGNNEGETQNPATSISAEVIEPSATPEPPQATATVATAAESLNDTPAATEAPTATVVPEDTATPTAVPLIVAGADKIAFVNGSNIWVANMDGTQLMQLTSDGAEKKSLRWLPDGEGLSYISGKCIQMVNLNAEVSTITCFNFADFLDAFEVSPDAAQVAISMDHQLYLVPFDLEQLKTADRQSRLTAMASCGDFAPYVRNFARTIKWSKDSRRIALVVMGVLNDGRRGDLITVFNVDRCIPNPMIQIQFPEPHFGYREYTKNPSLPSVAWDGEAIFVFNSETRNGGFGNLHFFNMESYSSYLYVDPVDSVCCYRDPSWSPDGTSLVLAFQNYMDGSKSTTQIYLIPFGTIGAGAKYQPLPLPEITDPRESPQPVLRPARAP